MKKLIIIASMIASSTVFAATTYVNTTPDNMAIITPDIASGVRRYVHFNNDTVGNMVVCEPDNYSYGKCSLWEYLPAKVPRNRKYVGFTIITIKATQYLQIWWK